jgi:molybdopterin-dependent oxidoreductase alpha subunit
LAEDLPKEDWSRIEEQSGLKREELYSVAERIARSERIICCWAMGLTQHENAVANIQQIVNLLLLKGSIGKPGAGVCPVRGHSNVQGDRTMGIWEKPSEAFLDRLGAAFDFDPPRRHGLDTVNAIRAMAEGQIKVFFAMGGNFLSATPDTEYTAAALQNCRLSVQVSTKLNRSHLVTGTSAIILPCLGRSERDLQLTGPQFVSVENSMGIVHRSQGHLPPASPQLRSEPSIVAGLAKATLASDTVDWDGLVADYDRIRELIEGVVPGTEDYNRRIRRPAGFSLPNPARQRIFETPSGKARFTLHPIPRQRLERGQYLMMTIRSHDQYNTTIYGLHDRYRGIHSERRVVMMHPEDIEGAGLSKGMVVDLKSSYDRERLAKRFVVTPYSIPRGCVATYFPEANVLVPIGNVARGSNTPASKSVVVSVHPAANAS